MSYTLNYRGAKIDELLGQVDEQFIAEYNVSLYADITAAIAAGKQILLKKDNALYPYIGQDATSAYTFAMVDEDAILQLFTVSTASVWATVSKALQEELTFDATPTDGSTNPVTSDGIYDAIEAAKAAAQAESYNLLVTDTAQGAIATFPDGADNIPVKSLVAQITPVQDLHGYDNPWPAGGGKNLCPITGGDVSVSNFTVTVQQDSNGNKTGIIVNGTNNNAGRYFYTFGTVDLAVGSYLLSGGYSANAAVNVQGNGINVSHNLGADVALNISTAGTYTVYCAIGTGVAFSNALVQPMIRDASIADSTFAPYSNICPISGWTGANIVRSGYNLFNPATATANKRMNNGAEINAIGYSHSDYIPVKAGETFYVLSGLASSVGEAVDVYDENKSFVQRFYSGTGNIGVTIPSNGAYLIVNYDTANQSNLCVGTSSTGYQSQKREPFAGLDTINVDWTTEEGTVYGGTLTYLGSGKYSLQQIMARVDLGTLTWTESSNNRVSSTGIASVVKRPPDANTAANILAEKYKTYSTNGMVTDGIIGVSINPTSGNIIARTGSSDNPTGYMIYELATLPDPIILDAEDVKTLLGDNNIFVDTGDVDVQYRCDTALYIDKKLGA